LLSHRRDEQSAHRDFIAALQIGASACGKRATLDTIVGYESSCRETPLADADRHRTIDLGAG
jgi:hypothetical protein